MFKYAQVAAAMVTVATINQAFAEVNSTDVNFPSWLVGRDIPAELQKLESQGEFTAAEKWIAEKGQSADTATSRTLSDEAERLRRLRREFSATADEMLTKLQKDIPGATAEDLEQWRKQKAIQWITIDGKPGFFRREPSTLLRFNEEAKKRAADAKGKKKDKATVEDPAARSGRSFTLDDHISSAVLAAKETGKDEVLNVRFKVKHTATLKPGIVPAGEIIRCWLPYPQAYRQQKEPKLISSSPAGAQVSKPGTAMRTLYMEQPAAADKPTVFEVNYEYESAAYVPDLSKPVAEEVAAAGPEYLKERLPHLEQSAAVKKLAAELVGDEKDPLKKARLIWDHCDSKIPWCAEIEYCTLPDIVAKVMTEKRGDCGTQALMMVALCRAVGIPARWQSGWVTKPGAWNMHDWAEFYVDSHGWLPADPSVGSRESKDPAIRDFLFGHVESYRMIANLDYCTQFDPPKQHLRSDPVDNQRGELEWKGGNLYYDQWEFDVDIDSEPVAN